ncbi:Signal transduction histidine kinase [bacterium A37T11]|nr:Signal transduction histidine kinase [bacterium A37T11]
MKEIVPKEKMPDADIDAVSGISSVPQMLEVICRTTGMGIAVVARVTKERWVACAARDELSIGLLPGRELNLDDTICSELDTCETAVAIEDADREENAEWCRKMARRGFKSYIAVPIRYKNGHFFGSLCAIDFKPAQLNKPELVEMFRLFAELIGFHLDAHERLQRTEQQLRAEQRIAKRRDQFIAILGHDLRNPLSAIISSAQLMERTGLDERGYRLVKNIQDSSFRMRGLIDNILDFAKGQLGSGLSLNQQIIEDAGTIVRQVLKEVKTIWPERQLKLSCAPELHLYGDAVCLSQIFSNLISNAVLHGDEYAPIEIAALKQHGHFLFSVSNRGKRIPTKIMKTLFEPFLRGDNKKEGQGLGLGLFIAYEIARGHSGKISASSDEDKTTFLFSMPLIDKESIAHPMK